MNRNSLPPNNTANFRNKQRLLKDFFYCGTERVCFIGREAFIRRYITDSCPDQDREKKRNLFVCVCVPTSEFSSHAVFMYSIRATPCL
jgi:hypothetical protein